MRTAAGDFVGTVCRMARAEPRGDPSDVRAYSSVRLGVRPDGGGRELAVHLGDVLEVSRP